MKHLQEIKDLVQFSFQLMTMFSANRDNNPKFWQCIAFVISGVLWWELTILAVRYLPEISQPFACKLLSYILVRTWCTRENCFILTNIATLELSWIPVSTRCRSSFSSSSLNLISVSASLQGPDLVSQHHVSSVPIIFHYILKNISTLVYFPNF